MTQIPMRYRNMALLDPEEYLELRLKNPGIIKHTKLVPPRIGRDNHFGKILFVFTQGRYEVAR